MPTPAKAPAPVAMSPSDALLSPTTLALRRMRMGGGRMGGAPRPLVAAGAPLGAPGAGSR